MAATYGGSAIFGYSVAMAHMLNPPAQQVNAFFGLSGLSSLWGGLRGRVFLVKGVWFGADLATLNAAESGYLTYIDGIARTLVDTRGRSFDWVLVDPPRVGERVLRDDRGFYLPYQGTLRGLV